GLNVIATLFFCLVLLRLLDRLSGKLPLQIAAALGFMVFLEAFPFDYGAYAVLLICIYRYASANAVVLLHLLLDAASLLFYGWTIQIYSVFASMLIIYWPDAVKA